MRTPGPAGFHQWPRAIHSSRFGDSSPIVVCGPWPVCTTVAGGRVNSRSRIDSMMVSKLENDRPVAPGPPLNSVSPLNSSPARA